ncbi:hypothetical protein RB11149 [Rhodopirellula baltica SH 1]|uniref:Uncharacterized protein n=1 Tax=Rhodopirellula baltica (strain DSM 10527 / NCIMB 13988 / SH1) TaxID=243090 RepID=Q7UJP5_RHOBA|nr:hypothetical protein RB11149 [Rhodopirellula baltica SH 1]
MEQRGLGGIRCGSVHIVGSHLGCFRSVCSVHISGRHFLMASHCICPATGLSRKARALNERKSRCGNAFRHAAASIQVRATADCRAEVGDGCIIQPTTLSVTDEPRR